MPTQPNIYLGTDDFADLLLNSDLFVDKSLFVKEFLEDSGKVVLITRPRRWGKSLNMDMLGRFLALEVDQAGTPIPQDQSLNRKLFMGGAVILNPEGPAKIKQLFPLKIAQAQAIVEDYQGRYPVISLGLKDVKGGAYAQMLVQIGELIAQTFKTHAYLLGSSKLDSHEKKKFKLFLNEEASPASFTTSLYFLSELLYKHFGQPVYILVDEYDTPINSAYLKLKDKDPAAFERVMELFRGLLGATFKSNKYLQKGLITGILRVAKANLFSDLNNVTEYTLLDDEFATSYGFTQGEVDTLLSKVSTEVTADQIQHWYNGYTFGGEVMYNPWSIMCCLAKKGKLDYYWIDSGGTALVDTVLLDDSIQEDLQKLVRGESLERIVDKKIVFDKLDGPDGLYSLLLFSGYLNPKAIDPIHRLYALSVPNHEVGYIYQERILSWVDQQLHLSSGGYVRLAKLLVEGKPAEFKDTLQAFLGQGASFYQTGSKMAEVFYNGFMLCLLSMLSSYYRLESEYESGLGKPDAVLLPRAESNSQGLILEYKVCKAAEDMPATAQAGLRQILAKDYAAKVRAYGRVQRILAVSLCFCGKEVALASECFSVTHLSQ
ncbi:MAG: AAA family ATPase [Bacteroidota bacterium]